MMFINHATMSSDATLNLDRCIGSCFARNLLIRCANQIIPLQRDDSDFADFFGDSDGGSFFGEIDEALKVKDPSVEYYPEPFCDMVEGERDIRQSLVK